ncbi:MAG: hypothetical protein ABI811_20310 [Acidobacteriota bacterium]
MSRAAFAVLSGIVISASLIERSRAQPPGAGAAVSAPVPANLAQLMRGTFYPAANIVFAAQDVNPADVPRAKDPSMATDLLTSSYGKWEAVENSALAMAELANLLMLPGRKCANGLDVPVKNQDWAKLVQELRDAGMSAYAAAQAKSQDKIIDATEVLANACLHCHVRYREKAKPDRCK